jgi:hypothetical protein
MEQECVGLYLMLMEQETRRVEHDAAGHGLLGGGGRPEALLA